MYTVLNCYGPARAVEREGFLEDLKKIINARALNNLIVCGDFNMIYDNEMDIIAGAPHSKREAESFSNFLKLSELEDTWRIMNGNHREFTWCRNTPYTARRLDYIFCDTNMSQHLITSDIKDFACTDHRAVMTNIHADNFPRGPSRWHFNSSHLRDKIFIDHMNAFIQKCLKEHEEENLDSRTSWEMLKASIRTECM